jgi:outer membrane biosynthesis protein TonB
MVEKKAGATKKKTGSASADDAAITLANGQRANEAAVDDGLACYGLDPSGDLPSKLARLRAHLADELLPTIPVDEHVRCEVCGEVGTDDTSACPFCGDAGVDEDTPAAAPEEPEKAPEPVPEPEPAVKPEKGKKGKPAPAETETKTKPEKGKKGKPAPVDEPAPAVSSSETPGEPEVSGGAMVASASEVAEGMAAKVADLDAAVARIAALAANAVANYYDLGIEIARVHRDELWKARGHASFKAWIETELPIARSTCYRLIEVVGQFDRDTYARVGLHKLALIAGGEDDDARATALEAAKAGASARDVQRIAAGDVEPETEKPARAKPEREKTEREKPKREGKISLVVKVDGDPKTYGWKSAKNGKAIKVHAPDSYVEIPIADGVVQRIGLKLDGEKIIGATVAFVRIAEPDEG